MWAQKSMQVFVRRYGLGASAGLHVVTHLQDLRTPAAQASIPRDACAILCPHAGQTRPDLTVSHPHLSPQPTSPPSPIKPCLALLHRENGGQPTPLISGFPPTCTDFPELSAWGFPSSPLSLCRCHLLGANTPSHLLCFLSQSSQLAYYTLCLFILLLPVSHTGRKAP